MAKRSNFYEVGKKILSNKYLTDIYDLDNSDVVKDIATIKHTFSSFKSAISVIQYYSERLDCKGEVLQLHYKLDGKIFDIKYKFNFSRIILDSGVYTDYTDYNVYIPDLSFTPIWVLCILDILRRNEDKFKGKEFSPYKRKPKKESKPKCKPADDIKEKSKFSYTYDSNNSDLENFKNIIKVFLKRNSINSNRLRLVFDDDLKELCNCIKDNFTIRDLVRCFRRTLSSSLSDCPKSLLVTYTPITSNFKFNTSLNVIEIKNSDGEYSYGVIDDEPVDNYLIIYVLAYVVQNVEKVSRIVGLTIGESTVPTNSFLESKDSTKEKTDYESVVEESNTTPIPTTVTSDKELVIDISGTEESKPKCEPADGTKEKPKFSYNYDPNNSDLENFKNIIKVFLRRNSIHSNLLRLIYDDELRELCYCIKNNFTIRSLMRCFRRTLSSSLSDCPKALIVCYKSTTLDFTFNTSLNVIKIKNSDREYSYGVNDDEPVENYLIMYVLAYVVKNVEKVSRIVGLTIGESTVPTNSFLESKNSTKEKTDYESVVEESNPTPIPTTVYDKELVIDISGTEESKPKCEPADDINEKSKFSYNYDSNISDLENFKNIIKVFLKRNFIDGNRYWLIYDDDIEELCNFIKDNFTVRSLMRSFRRTLSLSLRDCPKELLVYYKTTTLDFIFNTTLRTIEIQNSEGQYTYGVDANEPVDDYIIMYVLAYLIQNVKKVSKIVGLITEENILPNNRLSASKISIEDKTDYESKVVENNPALKPSIIITVTHDNELAIIISGNEEFRGSFDKVIKFENAIKAFDSKFKILNINANFIINQLTIQFDSKLSGKVIKELLLTTD